MDSINNAILAVTVLPVSNVQTLGGSVLPDRFISGSASQPASIMDGDLASSLHQCRQFASVIVPAIVA